MANFRFICVGCGLELAASDEIIGVFVRCDSCNVKQEVIKPELVEEASVSLDVLDDSVVKKTSKKNKKSPVPLLVALLLLVAAASSYVLYPKSTIENPSNSQLNSEFSDIKANASQVASASLKTFSGPVTSSAVITKNTDKGGVVVSKSVQGILEKYCIDCHGAKKKKGDVRLHDIAALDKGFQSSLLNKIEEQLFVEKMPPDDEEQLTAKEKKQLFDWLNAQYGRLAEKSKFQEKLKTPAYGNYVDHDKLFSGKYKDLQAFTYDRRWLISEFIFNEKFNRLVDHRPFRTVDGKRNYVFGDSHRRVNLTNPFLLPTNTGVRYYDNTTLNGGHLLTMITNAKNTAEYMSSERFMRSYPAMGTIMKLEHEHRKILKSREGFLNNFIGKVCQDIYKNKNSNLLSKFTPIKVKKAATVDANGKPLKKAAFHAANPGRDELRAIFLYVKKYKKKGVSDADIIKQCEKDWFDFGVNARKVQARVVFMNGYMEQICQQMNSGYNKNARIPDYRPLSDAEMKTITLSIQKHRKNGDRYNQVIGKCMADWTQSFKDERDAKGMPADKVINDLIIQLFVKVCERQPTITELEKYSELTKNYIKGLGNQYAIQKIIETLILRSEFVYRSEFGQGTADIHGRKMLSPWDASYALAYALTDSSPDKQLMDAVKKGKLSTREDYKREVTRMLKNRAQYYIIEENVARLRNCSSITNTPIRKLRFFREFFGYPKMLAIFKDNIRFGSNYDGAKGRLVNEADMLVDHILQNDKKVFEELLTTEKFYTFHSGDNKNMKKYSDRIKEIYNYFKDKGWEDFKMEDLAKHADFIAKVKMRGIDVKRLKAGGRYRPLSTFKRAMGSFTLRLNKGQKNAAPYDSFPAHGTSNASTRLGKQLNSPEVGKFFGIDFGNWDYPVKQPAKVANRKGMLTHPAWLIAHAQNTETDPVIRGKWIREKLLAGTVPDVPITVEAVIPEDHHKTLRDRLVGVTEKKECWKCHKYMNPLGYSFEIYDDFGVYRTKESLEHPDNLITKGQQKKPLHVDMRAVYKTLPVNAKGYLKGTGDKNLDGEVKDAIDLAGRLGKSTKVRQSIIRHVFRYFMGRNELLSDSKTLIDADQAYVQSGGSFDAVIISLLTSDSFIYRKKVNF